jgi:hypothetical protein
MRVQDPQVQEAVEQLQQLKQELATQEAMHAAFQDYSRDSMLQPYACDAATGHYIAEQRRCMYGSNSRTASRCQRQDVRGPANH